MGQLEIDYNCDGVDAIGDQPEASCNLVPHEGELDHRQARTSIYSFAESEHEDPYDLVPFIDQVRMALLFGFQSYYLMTKSTGTSHDLNRLPTGTRSAAVCQNGSEDYSGY
jgi:hypothetical protein